jgi:hypothetical protein
VDGQIESLELMFFFVQGKWGCQTLFLAVILISWQISFFSPCDILSSEMRKGSLGSSFGGYYVMLVVHTVSHEYRLDITSTNDFLLSRSIFLSYELP